MQLIKVEFWFLSGSHSSNFFFGEKVKGRVWTVDWIMTREGLIWDKLGWRVRAVNVT